MGLRNVPALGGTKEAGWRPASLEECAQETFNGVAGPLVPVRPGVSQDSDRSRVLTHLSVSVTNGLCEGAPSLSVLHLHWCIVGQQQMGAL